MVDEPPSCPLSASYVVPAATLYVPMAMSARATDDANVAVRSYLDYACCEAEITQCGAYLLGD